MTRPTQTLKDRLDEVKRDCALIEGQLLQQAQQREAIKEKYAKLQQEQRELQQALDMLK
jgi:chromosome segregation ATPase